MPGSRTRLSIGVAVVLALATATASAGPLEKAKDAVDPDCTAAKAARGAATKAAIGVRGNRCDVGETARDVTGVDGKAEEIKDRRDDADRGERLRDRK